MRRALALALGLGACEGAAASETPRRASDPAHVQAECEACHVAEAAAWRTSLHRAAFDDADFQASYARDRLAFCRGCHAPEADPAHEPDAWARSVGVSCASCHVQGDAIVAGPVPRSDEPAPHPLVRRTAAELDADCARCHEFDFPSGERWAPGTMMQTTMREHLASAQAELSCSDCHMPRGPGGVLDHGFASSRDPSRLRAAVRAVAHLDTGGVVLELAPVDVGHAFPTGDLFRRLSVEALALDPDGRPRASARRLLARHFPWQPPRVGDARAPVAEVPDDRLRGPVTVALPLATVPGDTVIWAVAYERVAHRDARFPLESELFARVELATGTL